MSILLLPLGILAVIGFIAWELCTYFFGKNHKNWGNYISTDEYQSPSISYPPISDSSDNLDRLNAAFKGSNVGNSIDHNIDGTPMLGGFTGVDIHGHSYGVTDSSFGSSDFGSNNHNI